VKVLRPGRKMLHVPIKLSWVYSRNTRGITVNTIIYTSTEVTILDKDFVEQMIMP